ncbi:MAG: hypothetical protein WC901_05610, partial [Candidatus Margulisiibacteriota bacterium]
MKNVTTNLKLHWNFYLVVFCSLLLCLFALFNVVLPGETFHWDESHHALYGIWLTKDIQAGNWDSFWQNTHHQATWPFLHSWLITTFFLIFGISYATARAANLFIFFFVLLGIWATGKYLSKENGTWIGLLGWLFWISSAWCWSLGTQNMIEALGTILTLGAFFSLLRLVQTKHWAWAIPLSLCLAAALVTKYNYAVLLVFPVALWAGIEIITDFFKSSTAAAVPAPYGTIKKQFQKPRQQFKPQPKNSLFDFGATVLFKSKLTILFKWCLIFSPLVLVFFWWFWGPESERKWALLWSIKGSVADTQGTPAAWLDFVTFYFKSLILSYPWFTLLGMAAVVGFWGSLYLPRKKETSLNLLLIFTWCALFLATFIIRAREARFIYTIVPLIYLCAATFWVYAWKDWRLRSSQGLQKIVILLSTALVLFSVIWQSSSPLQFFSGQKLPEGDFRGTHTRKEGL